MATSRITLEDLRHTPGKSDMPAHTQGTYKGEEWVRRYGREPGRTDEKASRTARDATGINAKARTPILPQMPELPPA